MTVHRYWLAVLCWMLSSLAQASILPPVVPKTLSTVFLPGQHTARMVHLEPEFRQQVEVLIERMGMHGYRVRVESTYRSHRRQDWLFFWSQWVKNLGSNTGFTNAAGGKSCHNMTVENHAPASLAVDLWGFRYGPFLRFNRRSMKKHRAFFILLGQEAKKLGLNWGGDFGGDSAWRVYGLGQDPPHVSSPRCRWQ